MTDVTDGCIPFVAWKGLALHSSNM